MIAKTPKNRNAISKIWKAAGVLSLLVMLAGWLALPIAASAHPLGNFTVNRYSRIDVGAAGLKLYYVIDMAEIPTFQEKDSIDTNHDNQVSDTEKQNYLSRKLQELQTNFKLTLSNTPVALKVAQSELAFLEGQGGLQTMRLTATFESDKLAVDANSLAYQDSNYSDRLGWKEIVIRNATGVALTKSSVPDATQSNELRTYPQDMLASPLDVTSAQASFKFDPTVVVNREATGTAASVIDRAQDPFADLIKGGELTLGVIRLSLLIAFGLGMLHALSPGHGKTVMGAYLVGTRGSARHAVFLGATVTITHTLGVFTLGLITLLASQFILPEKLYPWLGLISGLIVLGMGLTLLRSRLRRALIGTSDTAHSLDHVHTNDELEGYYNYDFTHEQDLTQNAPARFEKTAGSQTHTHGGSSHTHLPPGSDGAPVTWKRLLLFGISAGLLPCPSALVVMLSSIALGRTAFGLILIVFFSLGLACTLTGIGIALVYARKLTSRVKLNASSRVVRLLPVFSAAIVAIIGIAISYEAFIQTGVLNK